MREERERRQDFKDNHHTYLPSQFCPALKDQVQELRLDGPATEIDFANFPEVPVSLQSAF